MTTPKIQGVELSASSVLNDPELNGLNKSKGKSHEH